MYLRPGLYLRPGFYSRIYGSAVMIGSENRHFRVSSCNDVIRLVVDYVSGRARKAWPRFLCTDSGRALSHGLLYNIP